jgi:excisionase family DNA binding protein
MRNTLGFIPVYVYNIPMYSVKEAAKRLGLDTSQVRRLLATGEIKGVKLARDWVVLELNYSRKRKPGAGRKSKGV